MLLFLFIIFSCYSKIVKFQSFNVYKKIKRFSKNNKKLILFFSFLLLLIIFVLIFRENKNFDEEYIKYGFDKQDESENEQISIEEKRKIVERNLSDIFENSLFSFLPENFNKSSGDKIVEQNIMENVNLITFENYYELKIIKNNKEFKLFFERKADDNIDIYGQNPVILQINGNNTIIRLNTIMLKNVVFNFNNYANEPEVTFFDYIKKKNIKLDIRLNIYKKNDKFFLKKTKRIIDLNFKSSSKEYVFNFDLNNDKQVKTIYNCLTSAISSVY